jgi:hypothetical protein
MMGRLAVIGLLFSLPAGTSAWGGVYEFELPEAAGFSAGAELATRFIYEGPAGSVNSVSARIAGTVDYLGLLECYSTPPDTSTWPLEVGTFLQKPGESGYWSGSPPFLNQLGPFDETYENHTHTGGFSTVSDGDTILVDLYFYPSAYVGLCHPITEPSTGSLSSASILLDVSPPTSSRHTTWGCIKSLFGAP